MLYIIAATGAHYLSWCKERRIDPHQARMVKQPFDLAGIHGWDTTHEVIWISTPQWKNTDLILNELYRWRRERPLKSGLYANGGESTAPPARETNHAD